AGQWIFTRYAQEALVPGRGAARAARAALRRGARRVRCAVGGRGEGRAAPARARGERDPVLEPRDRDRGTPVRPGHRPARGPRREGDVPRRLGRGHGHDVAARTRVPAIDRLRPRFRGLVRHARLWQALALLALPAAVLTARAGLIEPPPAIVAMWDGKDG